MGTQYAFGQIVTDGLVLCLNASDRNSYVSGSTTWNDVSGRGNNGTLTNGPTFNSANGGSIVFDGTNDIINNNSLSAFGNNPRTMEIWFKGTGTDKLLISLGFSSGGVPNVAFALQLNSTSDVNIFGSTGPYDEYNISVTTNFINGNWHQAAVTWNGANPGTLLIYGDGNQVGSRTRSAGEAYATVAGYYIGGWMDNNRFFNGQVALARVYNRALTALEVQQNYNATKSRFGII
jgi:hypothetical protein